MEFKDNKKGQLERVLLQRENMEKDLNIPERKLSSRTGPKEGNYLTRAFFRTYGRNWTKTEAVANSLSTSQAKPMGKSHTQ